MNCDDLTTFIKKVFDSRDLIDHPERDFESAQKLMFETIEFASRYDRYSRDIERRIDLAKKFELKYIGGFHNGWALAYKKRGSGALFINRYAEILKDSEGTDLQIAIADRFSEGLAAVITPLGLRYLKPDGIFLTQSFGATSHSIDHYRFSEGYAVIPVEEGENIIDKSGEILLNRPWKQINKFSNGFAMVKDTFSHFIRPDETWLRDFEFKAGSGFSENKAFILSAKEGKQIWSLIDTNGDFIIEDLTTIDVSNSEIDEIQALRFGWAIFRTARNKFGYLNIAGKRLRDEFGKESFEMAQGFSEGFAVTIDLSTGTKKYRFMDINGQYLRDSQGQLLEFGWANDFNDGLARVIVGDPNGECEGYFINYKGKRVDFVE